MNTLIKNGLVLLHGESGWTCEKRDVLIAGNRIERIAPDVEPQDCTVIDATGMLAMPGLINAHTHAYMTFHRNYADDMAFFDWLDKVQVLEDYMTEEDVYWATLLAACEMIRSGTTCFVDMTIKSAQETDGPRSAAAGAVRDSGMRAVISRGLAGVADSEESIMKFGQAVREMELFKDESRLQFIHGPHAPYSCMADYLQKLTQSCKERGIGQTIHLSESRTEMAGVAEDHGTTPIQYVDGLGVFDVPVIAAHCVYATDEDIRLMAEKGVSVALNPKSNMKLGNGFAPAQKFLDAGINVCLGTDGCGSNNSLNLFSEMNVASLVYKGATEQAQCVSAADVLRMATLNGAKAIGREGELGVLAEGALADVILVNLNEPQFMPANNIVSGLVYSAKGSEVDTVIVDGELLMEHRRLVSIDEAKVFEECRAIMERLDAQVQERL
ncbi:5-methylthioadenosine/S-adenosylhomocysteine deaminase [Slackia heliotrinireducens]|uniref:5-methylthioadenosine/S-adenosylhomocysteine deaminase n=1 Tax=Slackia heliotrinireducens (strain ATCC 29202 / DSM 20476 / NCTC 11029 / RHS 1) TaxID=471855 RepID=C7N783_SLAHD|nr:amidohydrolase [Slackia heliotrinireducens]ACV22768.1 cytosine deaminase-like metal-dependent hydrolase [Slackia heliotrinireducens DSM 20476]VEH01440.1 5-methylthioadenosine/S-adenosylhomocysteine deaminase [Slackia heliotrinireducens]